MTHSNEVSFENTNNKRLWSLRSAFWNTFALGKQETVAGSLAFVHRLSSILSA